MSEIVGSSTGTVNGKHLAPLDGFRGLAIILVMIQHFAIISPTAPAGGHIMAFADGGWLGVDLFFVLSGYLTRIIHPVEFGALSFKHLASSEHT